ncbi:hypothetical protein X975_02221, partial [Stegodyphus mimosarum]
MNFQMPWLFWLQEHHTKPCLFLLYQAPISHKEYCYKKGHFFLPVKENLFSFELNQYL